MLWAALGVGEVGLSLLSSVLPVSELPEPELTPLKQKNVSLGFFFKSQTFSVFLSPSLEAVEFHPFYGYLRPDNALGYSAVSEKFIIL